MSFKWKNAHLKCHPTSSLTHRGREHLTKVTKFKLILTSHTLSPPTEKLGPISLHSLLSTKVEGIQNVFFIMNIFIFHDIHEKCGRFYGKTWWKIRKILGLKEKASYARFFLQPKGARFLHLFYQNLIIYRMQVFSRLYLKYWLSYGLFSNTTFQNKKKNVSFHPIWPSWGSQFHHIEHFYSAIFRAN